MISIDDRILSEAIARNIGNQADEWHGLSNDKKRTGLHRLAFLADELGITQAELCKVLVTQMIRTRYRHEDSLTEEQLIVWEIQDIEARDRFDDAAERSKDDWLSWAACNQIVRRARLHRELAPGALKDWDEPEPPRPKTIRNELHNELVAACVRVGAESGLSVYRNEATEAESVLDIVAACLNDAGITSAYGKSFGYETVRKVMNRRWDISPASCPMP